jgi:hypothetical protein
MIVAKQLIAMTWDMRYLLKCQGCLLSNWKVIHASIVSRMECRLESFAEVIFDHLLLGLQPYKTGLNQGYDTNEPHVG